MCLQAEQNFQTLIGTLTHQLEVYRKAEYNKKHGIEEDDEDTKAAAAKKKAEEEAELARKKKVETSLFHFAHTYDEVILSLNERLRSKRRLARKSKKNGQRLGERKRKLPLLQKLLAVQRKLSKQMKKKKMMTRKRMMTKKMMVKERARSQCTMAERQIVTPGHKRFPTFKLSYRRNSLG